MPRKYSMEQRSAAVQETRQRIVDATVDLHNEKGIKATSMQDIAERASVALATVYRHFPTLDELVPACGGRNLELNPPPTARVFEDMTSGEERIAALLGALYEHYERGARPYKAAFEALDLPVMTKFVMELASHLSSLVSAAAAPFEPDARRLSLVIGLCDFRVWRSLTQAGLSTEEAIDSMTRLICAALAENAAQKAGGTA